MHQVISNLVHTFDLKKILYEEEIWEDILSFTALAVRSMYNTTLQATPNQLMFRHDIILNTPFIYDWEAIRKCK